MNKLHCAAVSASSALLLAAVAAYAASNPEVVPPGCSRTVLEECVGVTSPTGGVVAAAGSCSNFTFRLGGVIPGVERISRTEVWAGGESCLEPKILPGAEIPLLPVISWSAPGGSATNAGDGLIVEVPRTNGACRATCAFTVACEPSVCDSPLPVVISAEAVFVDDVGVSEMVRPRLCCVSTNHAPHVFDKSGCDWPVMHIDPQDAADVVWQGREEAHVLGRRAGGALAVAEAPCGAGSNTFDVVTIGDFSVSGMCGCFSATDSTDDDSDAPTVETMNLGAGRTGYSLSLVASGWLDDTCWRITGGNWMPNAGSFGGGIQHTFAGADAASTSTIDAWFDCDPDCVRAQDEPKRRVVGTLARLGELTAVGDAERRKGDPVADDETFAP